MWAKHCRNFYRDVVHVFLLMSASQSQPQSTCYSELGDIAFTDAMGMCSTSRVALRSCNLKLSESYVRSITRRGISR
jgi:hypothetical protein